MTTTRPRWTAEGIRADLHATANAWAAHQSEVIDMAVTNRRQQIIADLLAEVQELRAVPPAAAPNTRDEALRNLGAFAEEHYAELMQALDRQAERCDQRAVALVDEREAALAKTMRESAASWRVLERGLRDAYRAVPDEEHGPGYRPNWGDEIVEG